MIQHATIVTARLEIKKFLFFDEYYSTSSRQILLFRQKTRRPTAARDKRAH